MAKRIYWQSMKKWAIGAGVPIGVAGFALLFMYLSFLGVMDVTGYSGDMICAGTLEDPCIALLNVTFKEDVFIYPIGYDPYGRETPFSTDKELKSWKIYRSWGNSWREIDLTKTCTATWCGAPPNSPDNKYSFAFREGRDYQIKIIAYKENPYETIKWGFGPVDPTWYGTNASFITEYGTNYTISPIGDGIKNLTAVMKNVTYLTFDGINDKVTVPASNMFGEDISVVMWLNTSGFDNWERIIGNDNFFTVNVDSSNHLGFKVVNGSGFKSDIDTTAVTMNSWHYFAGTYDDGYIKTYHNTILEGNSDYSPRGDIADVGNEIKLGGDITTHYFAGDLDEIKIYNKTLSQIQIVRLYNESNYGTGLGKSIPVLSYHQVRNTEGYDTIVNIGNFTEQMQFLYDTGYTTITYEDYYNWRDGTYALPEKPIILVFDDGFYNIYGNAFPIMESFNFVGVMPFIVEYESNEAGQPYGFMTWAQVTDLSAHGWEIAGHGSISYLDMTEEQRLANFSYIKQEIIDNVGVTPTHFVYPFLLNNDTIDSECDDYFTSCMGSNVGGYIWEGSNLTHTSGVNPLKRYIVHNYTRIDAFKDFTDYYEGLVWDFRFNENSGTILYDFSGNGNNGTITGATWGDDGVWTDLVEGIDYLLYKVLGIWELINPHLDRTGVNISYDYGNHDVNVSFGSGISSMIFSPYHYYSQDVWPENQTYSTGLFNITNNGTLTINTLSIRLNDTQTGWSLECTNSTTESWINLNTTYQTIYSGLAVNNSFQTWCRMDLDNPSSAWNAQVLFNITS